MPEAAGRSVRLLRALRFVWQASPAWAIASVALIVIQGLLPVLGLYTVKLVVDAVTEAVRAPGANAPTGRVLLMVALAGAVALAMALCRAAAAFVTETHARIVGNHMSEVLYTKSCEVDLAYYETPGYYDVLHRAQREAAYRPLQIVRDLAVVGRSSVSAVAILGLLVSLHWGIALILIGAVVPGVLVRALYARALHRKQRTWTPAERKVGYYGWILTCLEHSKELRLFDLGLRFLAQVRALRDQLHDERRRLAGRALLAELATYGAGTIAIFACFAMIAVWAVRGQLSIGELVMFYQAFYVGQTVVGDALGGLAGLYEHNLFLASIDEFLDLRRTVVEPAHPVPMPRPLRHGIVFDRVSFHYSPGGPPVLQDVSLTIPAGAVVALVGSNGSGKSTLIKLLCRLYDPTSGAITVDGVDLRQYATADLRHAIAVLLQDYAHYFAAAQDNIWFGDVGTPPTPARIATAAQRAGAAPLIDGLPDGYATLLGHLFEGGVELSVGEWQKVALARVVFRGAQIVVLDEPSSSLDALSEYEVFRRFRQIAEGCTTILISHRFSTVRMADRIHVLDCGRIVEQGTHDELIRRQGTYARAFEAQARYYR
jgi:ATP-binding cassette subfamily B protein